MFDRLKTDRTILAVSVIAMTAVPVAIFAYQATPPRQTTIQSEPATTVGHQNNGADNIADIAINQSDVISIVSCASVGCHGKAGPETKDAWRNSYVVWATRDPHADAYRTLWNEQSNEILKCLAGLSELDRAAKQTLVQDRCITCHSTVVQQDAAQNVLFNDGVNCQSCHGAGKGWLDAHVAESWQDKSPEEMSSLGFVELKDLNQRARTCVRCHVGHADQDMNHDLIAAGHPRLLFDFALYLERLPRHWSGHDDPKSLWEIGQVETTRAAVQLLKTRAERWIEKQPNSVWPEFAEFDCLNCHHEMNSGWFRETSGSSQDIGALTWGSWYAPSHSRQNRVYRSPFDYTLSILRTEMTQRQPQPENVIDLCDQADACLTQLDLWATVKQMPEFDWDALAHWYFAARACVKVLEDRNNSAGLGDLKRQLIELGDYLSVPFEDADAVTPNVDGHPFERESLEQLIRSIQSELPAKAPQ